MFIKEDSDLRGRAPGETAGLLCSGAHQAGLLPSCLHNIPGEVEAVREAMQRAHPGDVVVIFYEDLDRVMAVLDSFEAAAAEKAAAGAAVAPVEKAVAR